MISLRILCLKPLARVFQPIETRREINEQDSVAPWHKSFTTRDTSKNALSSHGKLFCLLYNELFNQQQVECISSTTMPFVLCKTQTLVFVMRRLSLLVNSHFIYLLGQLWTRWEKLN